MAKSAGKTKKQKNKKKIKKKAIRTNLVVGDGCNPSELTHHRASP